MRHRAYCVVLALLGLAAVGAPASAEAPKKPAATAKSRKTPSKRPSKTNKPADPPRKPPSKLPAPIEIDRIHVEVAEDRVLVTSEIALGKGDWAGEDLRAHVAYGAPGMPLAFEAHLCPPRPEQGEPECQPLPNEFARSAPSDAAFVIGPAKMAGQTIELESQKLADLFAQHSHAMLRLRQLRPMPIASASGHREILIRLGAMRGRPYRLGSIEIAGQGIAIADADARLCGPDVTPTELSLVRGGAASKGVPPRILERAGNEDLCLRFRLAPAQ